MITYLTISAVPTDTYLALLATTLFATTGAMCMPALVFLARTQTFRTACRRIARWLIVVLTSALALLLIEAVLDSEPAAAQTAPPEHAAISATVDATIEQLAASIKKGKRPLPGWLNVWTRAYAAWKARELEKRVGAVEQRTTEIAREVLAILKLVADVQTRIEANEDLDDREFRLVRELLDTHEARLDDLTGRVAVLEAKAVGQAKQIAAYRAITDALQRQATAARAMADELQRQLDDLTARFRRPGCGTGRAYRDGECIDVAANPR